MVTLSKATYNLYPKILGPWAGLMDKQLLMKTGPLAAATDTFSLMISALSAEAMDSLFPMAIR